MPQCQSTNDEAWKIIDNEEFTGNTLIYTHHQMAGRGQRGNVWQSQQGKNMLFSLMVRPQRLPATELFRANKAVALAAASILNKLSRLEVQIKWPNDLFVNGKKLGGILIESRLLGMEVEWLVIGIGINANQVDELPPTATSIALEIGSIISSDAWLVEIGSAVTEGISNVSLPTLPAEYRKRLLFLGETRSYFLEDGTVMEGHIEEVDDQGRLVLQDTSGKRHAFVHGGVTYFRQ